MSTSLARRPSGGPTHSTRGNSNPDHDVLLQWHRARRRNTLTLNRQLPASNRSRHDEPWCASSEAARRPARRGTIVLRAKLCWRMAGYAGCERASPSSIFCCEEQGRSPQESHASSQTQGSVSASASCRERFRRFRGFLETRPCFTGKSGTLENQGPGPAFCTVDYQDRQ